MHFSFSLEDGWKGGGRENVNNNLTKKRRGSKKILL
jgi:hypothetical protein